MQLICEIDTGGFDAWKSGFDDRAEARGQAGLTMLQMWRDADDGARAVVLFEVHDRARAEERSVGSDRRRAPRARRGPLSEDGMRPRGG